jgi:PelA/Pel-15E family pectate lyase
MLRSPNCSTMRTSPRYALLVVIGAAVLSTLGPGLSAAPMTWRQAQEQRAEWFGGPAAGQLAEVVAAHQLPDGGWPKNLDWTRPIAPAEWAAAREAGSTIDNDATLAELRFLAARHTAVPEERWAVAVARGLDFLHAGQLPNGGWPQRWPGATGYHAHITFNDHAMVGVLELLDEVARRRPPFSWVDDATARRAAAAVERGIELILRAQVVVNGARTVWAQQHDRETLAPAPGRAFEPAALTAGESARIVRFLMRLEEPAPKVVRAIEDAVAWYRRSRLEGLRLVDFVDEHGDRDRRVERDPAAPPLWARFYEIETNRPIFAGRDGVIRYDFNEIERERRLGYAYLRDWGTTLLERDYPAWRARRADGGAGEDSPPLS